MPAARTAAGRAGGRRQPGASAAGRLELLEALLVATDPVQCAQRALGWVQRRAGVRRGLCLAAQAGEGPRLIPVASLGVSADRAARFSVDLEVRDHPLTRALLAAGPMLIPPNGGATPVTLLGRTEVQAIPLAPLRSGDLPAGLLLLAPLTPALDGEGRIIIANARAEALLATDDDQSEGRRRAVALNNMLFSAALTRHAIEGAEAPRHEVPLVDPVDGSDLLFELLSTMTSDAREGTGIVSILRNVTDLQRATAELEDNYRKLRETEAGARAERDRLDLVIDSVADPILVTDPGGNIVMMNAPAEHLFTVAPEAASDEAQRGV